MLSEEGCDFVNYLAENLKIKEGTGADLVISRVASLQLLSTPPPFNCAQAWLASGVGIMPNLDTRADKPGSNVQHKKFRGALDVFEGLCRAFDYLVTDEGEKHILGVLFPKNLFHNSRFCVNSAPPKLNPIGTAWLQLKPTRTEVG